MLDISVINPYIRVAMHSIIPAGHEIKRRIIFDYELIYIADGEFTLTYNEKEHYCKKGQFILLRPGVPHSFSGIKVIFHSPISILILPTSATVHRFLFLLKIWTH